MAILLLGVLRVNPTSIRRRRKDSLAEETSISNDTLSTATNSTVNSLFHKTGPNSTDTHIGGGDFEEEDEEGEDEEIVGETATPPSDEYDSLLRDLNAREKVIITIQSVEMPLCDGQYHIECHYFCFSPLLSFSSICIFMASAYVLYFTTVCSCLIPSYPILSYYLLRISSFLLILKVILLEGLQKGLYGMAGKIQNHLYLLKEVRQRLLREELIIISENTGELLYFRTHANLPSRSAICTVYSVYCNIQYPAFHFFVLQ